MAGASGAVQTRALPWARAMMKMKHDLLAGALALAVCSPTQAQTGSDFFAHCTDPAAETCCQGYIQGVAGGWAEAMRLVEEEDNNSRAPLVFALCPPEGHNLEQTIDIVLKYLREHPERRDRPAAHSVMAALSEVWACYRQ